MMSETLSKTQINVLTGQVIKRDFNDDEIEQYKKDEKEQLKRLAELEAKTAARASALAKLADLGLTEAEINAL
jgi:hypothetical protein